ncbi:hypothetical protein AB0L88_41000 [Saccharopolyspora shandongensis]|uniref:Uncharacterized protein n=1 Tax=Saccharopolyspora shandongensis TaxID=418495 RepID=A0A1H3HDT9_9PSEU|nr:hypothetical protein [Saccharopolyspora shandongensis]SDY13500.1 hypothetical protein SAMN05216215_1020108 [Saccharopolyspora shandongensis]
MRKISRMAVLIPGGLLAAAVLVSGCTSLAGQSASTPPGPAVGVASAGGAANSEMGVVASGIHAVDIAVDLEFAENNGGWMVSYVEGKWDDSSMGAPHPVSAGGPTLVAALAADVELLSPFEGAEPTAEPQLDSEGLGVVPIALDDFVQQGNQSAKIWFDESGQVIKIVARYQP